MKHFINVGLGDNKWMYSIFFANAVSAIGVLVAAILAWMTSKKANEIANNAHATSYEFTKSQNNRDEEREYRIVAGCLHAWWAHEETGNSPWGIVVTNQGPYSAIFRDVNIEVTENGKKKQIRMAVAPPGRYVFYNNDANLFDFPRALSDATLMRPISKSTKHSVDVLDFTDQINCRWRWTQSDGLRRI